MKPLMMTIVMWSMICCAYAAEVFFIGHSLINHKMPRMLSELAAADESLQHSYAVQIINGAPLKYNWENSAKAEGSDARTVLPEGTVDVLVMTEAVPLDNHLKWSGSHEYAARFAALAREAKPEASVYIFETWHNVESGTGAEIAYDKKGHLPWRERLDTDFEKWQQLAQAAGENVKLIPGGQALAQLHDAIAKKEVPELENIRDVFHDDIHMNDIGNYYIACLHYAVMYGKSPVGLPHELTDQWGKTFQAPSADLAIVLQRMAWQVAQTQPR
jgi:hypothetical protein